MVIIIKTIIKLLLFFSIAIFDIDSIDSNSDKVLLIDRVNIHDENNYNIYFKDNVNVYDLDIIVDNYNIKINSYIIDNKKYYAKDINELIDKYSIDKNMEEKIYYKLRGFNIDGLNVTCENIDLINLSKVEKLY